MYAIEPQINITQTTLFSIYRMVNKILIHVGVKKFKHQMLHNLQILTHNFLRIVFSSACVQRDQHLLLQWSSD
jgi:hypothetical protein